jgi:RIO kinase 1
LITFGLLFRRPTVTLDSSFSQAFSELSFNDIELVDGQRWSTWQSITPSQRGPKPWPDWVITSAAAIDTEFGIVKTGKEADVFLIERAIPDTDVRSILAAKRYRGADHRDFHRSSAYEEGRRTRKSRDARAISQKTGYGRMLAAGHWAYAEFEALGRLHDLGAPVPYPVQVNGTELLMEFIGTDGRAAPRLAQVREDRAVLRDYLDQVVAIMGILARAGWAHGDLSPYNLLVHEGRVIVIDLPQIVDAVTNPGGLDFLHRDCVNIADWFTRHRVEVDAEALFADLVGELY